MRGVRRLGRYEVGEQLGSGGLGAVYLAHVEGASGFRKRVVIKKIRDDLAARPETAALLRGEAEAVQRLTHGNIVQVLDFGVDDGAPYLVMEHVDGATLAELAGSERLAVAAALFVVESVCAALEHAHGHGLVHRDVTPSNVMVSRDGVVKLTDFGVSTLVAAAATVGTPGYAAPEQLAGEVVDGRADVYALGVVLAELLRGAGDAALTEIAARAAAQARSDRFASAQGFAAALEQWRAARGVLRGPGGLAEAVQALQRRRGRVADSVGAALGERARPAVTAMQATPEPRRGRWIAGGVFAAGAACVAVIATREAPEIVTEAAREVEPPARPEPPPPREMVAPPPTKASEPPAPRGEVAATRPRAPAKGRLLVNLVPWAQASVDGRDLGRTPIAVTLPAGRYTLTLANPDLGQQRTRRIAIASGADTNITDW